MMTQKLVWGARSLGVILSFLYIHLSLKFLTMLIKTNHSTLDMVAD